MGHQHSHDNSHTHDHDHQKNQHNHNHQNNQKPQKKKPTNFFELPPSNSPNYMNFPQLGGQIFVDKVKKVFIKEIEIFQYEYKLTRKLLQKRSNLKHPNFVTIKNYRFQKLEDQGNQRFLERRNKAKGFSFLYPESHVLKIQFQPVVLHIQGLIKNHCKLRTPIQQQQIRRIMKSVVSCLLFLKQNSTYHGDIKPTTIYIHPKTRQVKIVDSLLFNKGKVSYQIVEQNPGAQSYLTPQQLQKNKEKLPDSLENIHQAEVFCVGMTLLQMMTFQSSMEAYNLELLEIRPQFIQRKLAQCNQYGYSFALADLSLRCIHKNPQIRPKFQEIIRAL